MSREFSTENTLDLLSRITNEVDPYSEYVYIIEQEVRFLFEAVLSYKVECSNPQDCLARLIRMEVLMESKIRRKENFEAVMRQITS